MSLSNYTEEELAAELLNRKLPKQKDPDKIDWSQVLEYIKECHVSMINNNYAPQDYEFNTFKLVLKAAYDNSNFKWYKS
jgi:hypothetical protein